MIEHKQGNLLEADAEALVNTVNCVGAMGKGIALQFKLAFPENFKEYAKACRHEEVKLGCMFTVPTGELYPRYIINFPTKDHWRGSSRIEDIRAGLVALVEEIKRLEISSVAIPPLGCGNGGLRWSEVRPLIEEAMAAMPDVHVLLFAPQAAPEADKMVVATKKPNMSRSRALLIQLMEFYRAPGYRLMMLEVQKLAYFLQASGLDMKLDYSRNRFGPYSEKLNYVLQPMEGHFIRGYGDRDKQSPGINLLSGATEAAHKQLADDTEAQEHLERVAQLVESFETPYSMELLASVHYVVQENPAIANDVNAVITVVRSWTQRKEKLFTPEHIKVAWQHLHDKGWLTAVTQPATTQVHESVA